KTVLCLERGQIPPTAHFRKPNPQIDFEGTPFHVSSEISEWRRGETPRRAGVSSFGVGGTNAHVVLEEAAPQAATTASERGVHIPPPPAAGKEELKSLAERVAAAVSEPGAPQLADVAWTLAGGRRQLSFRTAVAVRDPAGAAARLVGPLPIGTADPAPR